MIYHHISDHMMKVVALSQHQSETYLGIIWIILILSLHYGFGHPNLDAFLPHQYFVHRRLPEECKHRSFDNSSSTRMSPVFHSHQMVSLVSYESCNAQVFIAVGLIRTVFNHAFVMSKPGPSEPALTFLTTSANASGPER